MRVAGTAATHPSKPSLTHRRKRNPRDNETVKKNIFTAKDFSARTVIVDQNHPNNNMIYNDNLADRWNCMLLDAHIIIYIYIDVKMYIYI